MNSQLNATAPIFQPTTQRAETISASQSDNINSVTVLPTINLHEAQRQDECISQIIQLKLQKKPRPDITEWADDPVLKKFLV